MMEEKELEGFLARGLFTELDIHFARLLGRLSETDNPHLFLAAALVSRATTEGHVCLDLTRAQAHPLAPEGSVSRDDRCPDLDVWRRHLLDCKAVGRPGDYAPLILDDHHRLYLYRYWAYEQALLREIQTRTADKVEGIDDAALGEGLSRLFGQARNEEANWQKLAAYVCAVKRFCAISGGPGTGKSTVISKVLALILEQAPGHRARVALTAPTGKAAARLEQAVREGKDALPVKKAVREALLAEASTLHRLLGPVPRSPFFRHNRDNPLPVDLVVVDEASMVDLALMSKLMQALPAAARLILMGDQDQLASVEAGAVLGDICDTGRGHGHSASLLEHYCRVSGESAPPSPDVAPPIRDCVVRLRKSYRFGVGSGIAQVSRAVNSGEGEAALERIKSGRHEDISWRPLPDPQDLGRALRQILLEGYRPCLEATDTHEMFHAYDRFRLLCALRKGPYGAAALNRLAEQILRREGLIPAEGRWYPGRPVLITRNDYTLDLFNGDMGIVLPDPSAGGEPRVFFRTPEGSLRGFLPFRLPEHETAYAMTVHKSQGSEFDGALLILSDRPSPVLTRELIYTGVTRARHRVEVWGRDEVFLEGVSQRTVRASGLRDALWGEGP